MWSIPLPKRPARELRLLTYSPWAELLRRLEGQRREVPNDASQLPAVCSNKQCKSLYWNKPRQKRRAN
jgi:hypothetical protein